MTAQPSYDPARGARGLDGELARLEVQAALSWDRECRLLDRLGVRDGARILEVGCGPGVVTRRLRAAFPSSPITALDRDPVLLDRARAAELPAVTVAAATAEATGLPEGGFDLVLSRYLYQHLPDPAAAAREALRVLAPGGLHAVVDIDDALWGIADPPAPGLSAILARQTEAQAARDGDRRIGRWLWRLLKQTGHADPELDLFAYHSDALGKDPFLPQMAPERFLDQVDAAAITPGDLGRVYAAFDRFARDPDAYVLMVGFLASGRKP
jgi:ubiquinone/menaquinone biosynthesis C-methylase UbiE